MLKSRGIVRKTKRGTIIKLVKEHCEYCITRKKADYVDLRDDIACGFEGCLECKPTQIPKLDKQKMLIIPDTQFALKQVGLPDYYVIK